MLPHESIDPTGFFQNLMDGLPLGILFCDTEYTVLFVNRFYANLLGEEPRNVVGKPLPNFIPGTRAPIVLSSGKAEMADLCTLPRFGDSYKFIVNRIPVRDDQGVLQGMLSHIAFTDPSELKALNEKIERLHGKLQFYKSSIKSFLTAQYNCDCIIGNSELTQILKMQIKNYAAVEHPVLVLGKTGTGKELVAHALHTEGTRSNGPFITINCAAIPKDLFESELFGYAPGAFSGAHKDGKIGKIELANYGTLFLDEIGEIPMQVQAKLLRVLEEKCITRVGGVQIKHIDFRLISATNRDLQAMIENLLFREDLYYRINTLIISITPLHNRVDDIMPLARYTLERIGCQHILFTPHAEQIMKAYEWPGNARQMYNILIHASTACENGVIDSKDLPRELVESVCSPHNKYDDTKKLHTFLGSHESSFILDALRDNDWNVSATARKLQCSRVTLYEKMNKYGIKRKSFH